MGDYLFIIHIIDMHLLLGRYSDYVMKGDKNMKRMNIVALVISILIPLAVGGISAALTSKGMTMYSSMEKPPLSPPAWVFSVAWTLLYIMMGLASYFIIVSEADPRSKAMVLTIYGIQLAMNFMWSIVFFNWGMFLFAFIWLVIMWALVCFCAFRFASISSIAGYLMSPYVLWLIFAAYLNFGAYMLRMDDK